MAAEEQQQAAAASSSGGGAAGCTGGGGCRPYGSTPMCARCYAEKIARPMQELEGVLAEIRRVNAGKTAERDGRVVNVKGSRAHGGGGGAIIRAPRTRDCC